MKQLLLFVLLGVSLTTMASDQQPTPDNGRLKARLWFLTTQRIWRDSKSTQPQPLIDNLTLALVQKRLEAADNANADEGAYDLYNKVEAKLGTMETASPKQVSAAIIKLLRKGRRNNNVRLAKVDSLEAQFDWLTNLPPSSDSGPEMPGKNVAKGETSVASLTVAPILHVQNADPISLQRQSFTQLHPLLALLMAGMLGLLLGLTLSFLGARWLRKQQSSVKTPIIPPTLTQEKDFPGATDSPSAKYSEREKLREENRRLNNQIIDLEQQVLALTKHNRIQPEPSISANAQTTLSAPFKQEAKNLPGTTPASSVQAVAPVQQPPKTLIKRYATAVEDPFLEDRKLSPEPFDHLRIELTIDPNLPNEATFSLSPFTKKEGNSDEFDYLKNFFEFGRPDKKVFSLRAIKPEGKLLLKEGRWQISWKAGLDLS